MAVLISYSTPADGTTAIFTLITTLCSAGWLIKAWSDGTTLTNDVSLSTNPYGSASSGAGNLGNTSAWFRISAPNASREWMFQRGAAAQTWTVARSRLTFTGGSPSATVLPTDATSGLTLMSAGTLFDSSLTSRWFISTESAAPYGWTCFTIISGGGNIRTIIADEPLASGTYQTLDTDPCFSLLYYNATGFASANGFNVTLGSTALLYKRVRHGLSSSSNARAAPLVYSGYTGVQYAPAVNGSNQVGPEPYTGNYDEFPLPIPIDIYGATGTGTGWCGLSNRWRWNTVANRTNGQTLNVGSGASYWIYMAGVWVPWDSSTPII